MPVDTTTSIRNSQIRCVELVQLMAWLEGSALGQFMRDNGVWFYGIINLAHIVGVAILFGSVAILDLRLLGFWPDAPLSAISRPTTRMAAAGFVRIR